MNIGDIIDYLKRLSANNDRSWFLAHKEEYLAVKQAYDDVVAAAIGRIALFDESVAHLSPSDCTYRIYRDTRFSKDKSPYKNHLGAYINSWGKKSNHCGYYIHIEPGNCMFAGGGWGLPPAMLKAVRQSIIDNIDEFMEIVEDPEFKKYFPVLGEEHLKVMPKGFPKDFAYPEYIKCKDYVTWCNISDEEACSSGFFDKMEDVFRQLKRLSDFMNYTIDEMEDELYE